MVLWTFFAPYLWHCNRNNTSDKLRSTFWRNKNVQKTKFTAAEMILDPWNQQYIYYMVFSISEKPVNETSFNSQMHKMFFLQIYVMIAYLL